MLKQASAEVGAFVVIMTWSPTSLFHPIHKNSLDQNYRIAAIEEKNLKQKTIQVFHSQSHFFFKDPDLCFAFDFTSQVMIYGRGKGL